MRDGLTWMLLLILPFVLVTSRPVQDSEDVREIDIHASSAVARNSDQVISVSITSSVAVGRGTGRPREILEPVSSPEQGKTKESFELIDDLVAHETVSATPAIASIGTIIASNETDEEHVSSLAGANIEFIKQLHSKKEARGTHHLEVHPFQLQIKHHMANESDGPADHTEIPAPQISDEINEDIDTIPLGRSIALSPSQNRIQGMSSERGQGANESGGPADHTQIPTPQIGDEMNEDIDTIPLGRSIALYPSQNRIQGMSSERGQGANESGGPADHTQIPTPQIGEEMNEDIDTIPLGRSIALSPSQNRIQDLSSERGQGANESGGSADHTEIPTPQFGDEINEDIDNIPLGRSVALSPSQNHIHGQSSERRQRPRLTTVSFNVVHDTPKTISNYNDNSKPAQAFPDLQPVYSEPPKVYSQPAKVYSEPAKFYSEPAKVYSEPAKVYSEPAKVYSEPAKVYSEPAKFYSPQASLNLPQDAPPVPWQEASSSAGTTPSTTTSVQPEHRPEKNYEVDEKDSVLTDGQSHGVQEGPESCKDDSCKVGYVVEGRQYRKYRVEERTADGFIVGEYGVVRNEDGALRGVRYTADGDASPRLIYDALMKFLQL